MSEAYNVKIVKFEGSFDNMDQLNADLRKLIPTSEFMETLDEAANSSGISNVDLFGITTTHYDPGKLGLVSQDEGSVDNDHYQCARYYIDFDNEMCEVIKSHLTENSLLAISFDIPGDLDQWIYVITDSSVDKLSLLELVELF
ncbi:MAG: hypothetical protein [Caudoviricetes sp.]|nr:MAG: hypothetical protein [Caudoviricetes sp.]